MSEARLLRTPEVGAGLRRRSAGFSPHQRPQQRKWAESSWDLRSSGHGSGLNAAPQQFLTQPLKPASSSPYAAVTGAETDSSPSPPSAGERVGVRASACFHSSLALPVPEPIGLLPEESFTQRKPPQPTLSPADGGEGKTWIPWYWLWLIVPFWLSGFACEAATKAFTLSGVSLTLEDVSTEVDVRYEWLRFSRAAGAWSFELVLENKGTRNVRGPFVVLVDGFSGTSGPLSPDGRDNSQPAKAFYDLSSSVAAGVLRPGERSQPRTILLGRTTEAPTIRLKTFAQSAAVAQGRAFTRTLDALGHPLGSVEVLETGPQGQRSYLTDPSLGVATLGQGAGEHTWRFSKTNFLPAWTRKSLASNDLTVLPGARLILRDTNQFRFTPLDGGKADSDPPAIQISFAPGSFAQNASATLTRLTGQTLPTPLPAGWSVVQGFWFQVATEPSRPGAVALVPWTSLIVRERVALVQFQENTLDWRVVQLGEGAGTNAIPFGVAGSGAYALVVADTGVSAPPAPVVGQRLEGTSLAAPDFAQLRATGRVTPSVSAASLDPALVTASAEVLITNVTRSALASGLPLACEVSESYEMQDGSRRLLPRYETVITGYQRPGDNDPASLTASFQMRPILLFGADELAKATIRVDVMGSMSFSGGLIEPSGGQVTAAGLRVTAGPGVVNATQALQLRALEPTNFVNLAPPDMTIDRAFELTMAGIQEGQHLTLQFSTPPTNGLFVLARTLYRDGMYGLEPVERFRGDANGSLASVEPVTGERLPGITASGQYLLLRVPSLLGLIQGIARDARANPIGGVAMRTAGQPWLTFSAANGRYQILAPESLALVRATDPRTGNSGEATIRVTANTVAVLDVLTVAAGPRVVSVNPTNGATAVPRVTSVNVAFNKPINPANVAAGAVQIIDTNNQPVTASLALNLQNNVITLLPVNSLAANVTYTIRVSSNLTDTSGLRLEGPALFTFTTARDNLVRSAGAQVISHEPLNGSARMEGTQGIADPGAPVILVNDTTGQTSTTLAGPDGSFTGQIAASVEDRLRAVFVNQNGTRTEIPVGRQLFPDGSVALYSGGGAITNANSELSVALEVPPGAIVGRTKFKIEPLKTSDLAALTSNTPPENATAFGLFNLNVEGDKMVAPVKFTFRPDFSKLVPPPGKTVDDIALIAASPRAVEQIGVNGPTNVIAYEFLGLLQPVTPSNQVTRAGLKRQSFSDFYYLLINPDAGRVALMGTVQYLHTAIGGRTQSGLFRGGQDLIQGTEIPLGGAVVRARATSQENSRPFSLQGGETYTTSDATGHFQFLVPAPAVGGHALIATHPDFPGQFASSAGLRFDPSHPYGGGFITFDRRRPADTSPPSIVITHLPTFPQVTQGALVRVETLDDSGVPSVALTIDSVDPLSARTSLSPQQPNTWLLQCSEPAKVVLKAVARDGAGNQREQVYSVLFGQPAALPPSANDPFGPYVVFSDPDANAVGVPTTTTFQLQFSKPVDAALLTTPGTYLTLSPSAGTPSVSFGRDQREVIVRYVELENNRDYLFVVQGLRGLNGLVLDQNPATNSPPAEPFMLRFRTAEEVHANLIDVADGAGAVMRGAYAYLIDRHYETLNQYDVSTPSAPILFAQRQLTGSPRSLALIPNYSYTLEFPGGIPGPTPPQNPLRSDLLAVAGQVTGQKESYLRIYDIRQPLDTGAHIAGSILSLDQTALITKLVWSPPYLVAVENNLGSPAMHVLNLQTVLLGDAYRKLTRLELDSLPFSSTPGLDANNDGDFVDPNDQLPVVGRDLLDFVLGETDVLSLAPNRLGPNGGVQNIRNASRFITDVVVDGSSGFVGALINSGADTYIEALATGLATNTISRPTSFRSFVVGQNSPDTALPPVSAGAKYVLEFPGWQPKRALLLTLGIQKLVVLNLLSSDNVSNSVRVIDVTSPDFLIETSQIPLPVSDFGLVQGSALDDQGRVVLSTVRPDGEHFVLLDPTKLQLPAPVSGFHPAIIGLVTGAGSGVMPFTWQANGISVASLRQRSLVTQTPPLVRMVGPDTNWFDAFGSVDLSDQLEAIRRLPDVERVPVAHHGTNVSNLIPPDAKYHFKMLVEAPGGAGQQISLALMSLDAKGNVVVRTNNLLPPAVLADVPLHRLSDDPHEPAFNVYLSRPISVSADNIDANELVRIRNRLDRHVLFTGDRIRVGISDRLFGNQVLGTFAGGTVNTAPPTNTPPARLGVSLTRPVTGNIQPELTADDTVVIQTSVDRVNGLSCPGSAWLNYFHAPDCKISLYIDGQPAGNVYDENGVLITVFTNTPSVGGNHRVLLDAAHVGAPGEHQFELIATEYDQAPNTTLRRSGRILHEVEVRSAFAIGHSVVEGVDLFDGHLSHSRQDVMVPGRKLSLEFNRSYSSSGNSSEGPLGAGWTHSYNCRLIVRCGVFTIVGGEGSGNSFVNPQPNNAKATLFLPLLPAGVTAANAEFFKPQIGYHSNLVRDRNRASEAWFFTRTGVRYHFIVEPKLSSSSATVYTLREIREPNGNALKFDYLDNDPDPATLDTVTEIEPMSSVQKRGFRFEYRNIARTPRIVALRGFNQQGSRDLLGLEVRYAYDEWGNLTNVVRVGQTADDTRSESYLYTSGDGPTGHNLTDFIDANGAITHYDYQAPVGTGTTNYYTAAAAPAPLPGVPPHEIVRSVRHVGAARPGFAATADAVTSFRYDFLNFLRYVSDPRPADGDGTPIPETEYQLNFYGATLRIRAPLGQETVMEWATDHRNGSVLDENRQPVNDVLMTYKRDAEGQEQFFEYTDGRGNLTRQRIVFTGSSKRAVTDAAGTAVSEIVMRYEYHPLFNERTLIVDAEGYPTVHELDPATGNLWTSIDADGKETKFSYLPNGDLETRTDGRQLVTRFQRYDLYGNAEKIADPLNNFSESIYDERSRLREHSDSFTHHARFSYDSLDRRVTEEHLDDLSGLAAGPAVIVTGTRYLPGGEARSSTNALGLVVQFEYDALNRQVRTFERGIRQADGTAADYETTTRFDPAGNVIGQTDRRGVIQNHFHDALGRLVRTEVSGPYGGPSNGNGVVVRSSYDRANNITNSVNLYGFATGFAYDALYRVVETRLPLTGAVPLTARFDRAGNKTRTTDANGNATEFTFNRLHRLVRTRDAESNVILYDYDQAGNRTNETQVSSGLQVKTEYDALNRPRKRTQTGPGLPGAGYEISFDYRDSRNEVIATNARGRKTRTHKDGLDRVAETVVDDGGLNLTTQYTYNAAGNVLTMTDAQNGDVDLTHEYDQLGRRIRTTYVSTPSDTNVVFETFSYDPGGNVIGARDKRGFEHRNTFDNLGRPRLQEIRETISNGGSWLALTTTTYDDARNTVFTRDPRGNETKIENDELGRPQKITDPLGQITEIGYDGVNRRFVIDKRRLRTEFAYDRINRVRRTTEFETNGVAATSTRIEYFDSQRRQQSINPRGIVTTTEFDAIGRPLRTEKTGGDLLTRYGRDPLLMELREYDGNHNVVNLTDGNSHVTHHEYDGADRRIATIEGFGSAVATTNTFAYDKIGNLIASKDGRAHGAPIDVASGYDARYRRVASTNALGEVTRFRYDPAGNIIEITDPRGNSSRYEYDEMNALLAVDDTPRDTAGDAGVTRFRYDAERNRIAQQDAENNLVTLAYDALNRLTNRLEHLAPGTLGTGVNRSGSFGGGPTLAWSFSYDANNNQIGTTDARNQQVTLTYDYLDRLILRRYSGHAETNAAGNLLDFQPVQTAYQYDPNGNLTNCIEIKQLGTVPVPERTVSVYDALDRLITKTRFDYDDAVGRTLQFGYDVAGNRTNIVDADLRITEYGYDERNRLKSVTLDKGAAGLTASYSWEADSLLRRVDLPGGSYSLRTYDAADRILTITNANTSNVIFSIYRYAYDLNGNRTNQVEQQPAISALAQTTAYQYDKLDRLVRVAYDANATVYTYARNGNRLTEKGNAAITGTPIDRLYHYTELPGKAGITFNGVNSLTRIEDKTPAANHIDYEYDRNLNQIARIQGGDRRTMRYDIRDQLISASTPNGSARFDYNADRVRAKKLFGASETRYLYDQAAVLLEYGNQAAGYATQHKYDYGYHLLALGAPNATSVRRDFFLTDALMSTANLVSDTGTLTHSYRYDAWGRVRAQQGNSDNPRQYTGHYHDSETGLHYFGARYYDDEQARFLSQDPYLGESSTPPSLHRYLYAYGNPLRYTDLTGYAPQNSAEADKWIKETQQYLKQLDQQLVKDAEAATPGAARIMAEGRKAAVELERMNEEHKRMLAESGLTDADLKNPVMADRARWGMALLRRNLGEWVSEGKGGEILGPALATAAELVAGMIVSPLETGAAAGSVAGKVDVGAQVTAGEWIAAGADVLQIVSTVAPLGKIGASVLARQAERTAARQAVIAEARTTIGRAAAEAQELIQAAPKRLAAERAAYEQSRLAAALHSPAGMPKTSAAFGETGYAQTFLHDTKFAPFPPVGSVRGPIRIPASAFEAGTMPGGAFRNGALNGVESGWWKKFTPEEAQLNHTFVGQLFSPLSFGESSCSAAAACEVLGLQGKRVPIERFAAFAKTGGAGTYTDDLWRAFQHFQGKGRLMQLKSHLDLARNVSRQSPAITAVQEVLLNGKRVGGHTIAVYEVDMLKGQVLLSDPIQGRGWVPLSEFVQIWDKTGSIITK